VSKSLPKRFGQFRLSRHYAPKLLAGRSGKASEVLLGQPASDAQYLDVLAKRSQLWETGQLGVRPG